MEARDFCYWLQGLLEVGRPTFLDSTQIKQIQDHLDLVFKKVTPSVPNINPFPPNAEILRKYLEKSQQPPPRVECSFGQNHRDGETVLIC